MEPLPASWPKKRAKVQLFFEMTKFFNAFLVKKVFLLSLAYKRKTPHCCGAFAYRGPQSKPSLGCLLWGKRSIIRSTLQGLCPQSCKYYYKRAP